MKKLIIFACSLMAGVSASAQDVLITQEGDVKKVYDVEVGPSTVFYKEADKADAPTLRIKKADVIMIKRKDGTKYDLGNGVQPSNTTSSTSSPAQASSSQTASISTESKKRNDEIISQANNFNPEYVGTDTKKDCDRVFCIMGYGNGSQLVNDDLEIECIIGSGSLTTATRNSLVGAMNNGVDNSGSSVTDFSFFYSNPVFRLCLKNKTNRTLYVDLGNSFIMRNGVATAYYIPTSTSTSNSSSSGASVNLGAVAGAIGVGGALGTLAGGVNVGGGSTSGSVSTTYSQRVVAVPPMSVKELDNQLLFPDPYKYKACDGLTIDCSSPKNWIPAFSFATKADGDYMNGETHDFSEGTSPIKFAFLVSYSDTETCQNEKSLSFNLHLRRIVGFAKSSGYPKTVCSKLPKVIPDFKKCTAFVGLVIEGMWKSLPKNDVFKRGDK